MMPLHKSLNPRPLAQPRDPYPPSKYFNTINLNRANHERDGIKGNNMISNLPFGGNQLGPGVPRNNNYSIPILKPKMQMSSTSKISGDYLQPYPKSSKY